MRARVEPFGAWVKVDEPDALVAVDRTLARKLGIDGERAWQADAADGPTRPLEVHVAVTARCPAGCEGCYLDAAPDGLEPPLAELEARLSAAAALGAFTVAFGGGEPLTREDIGEVARIARRSGLSPVMTTSGIGLTRAKALTLSAFAQVNVSYDGVGEAYGDVRGFDGRRIAERAMVELAAAGVPFGVNMVLTRASFGSLEATAAHVASLGARELQLLRYKPAGRAASLDYLARRLSPEQVRELYPALGRVVGRGELAVRIECSMVPLLSLHLAGADDVAKLERFGVMGCEAGRHLAALRTDGRLAPCSFAEPTVVPSDDLAAGWQADDELSRWRAHHATPSEPCASCPVRPVCRGGCQVVGRHLGRGFGPDPECPRVLAHAAEIAGPR